GWVRGRDVRGATMVLDSKGGPVLGAIALGRAIRSLNLATTVGRVREQATRDSKSKRAWVWPRAECQSMCPFVLLGGVKRTIPAEARVLVHQIWLGDRRDDAAAATYSAEDLVLVQRDIGRLVQSTPDIGGGADRGAGGGAGVGGGRGGAAPPRRLQPGSSPGGIGARLVGGQCAGRHAAAERRWSPRWKSARLDPGAARRRNHAGAGASAHG